MLLGYDVILGGSLMLGVDVGKDMEGADVVDMPNVCSLAEPDTGVDVERRFGGVFTCEMSCLAGYEDEFVDADDVARPRPACVSRRLLGPSLTLGCV